MKITFRDFNPAVCIALANTFPEEAYFTIEESFIFRKEDKFDALFSPANSFGYMDGGIDWVYRNKFGQGVEDNLKRIILDWYDGELMIGQALLMPLTMPSAYRYMIAAPTMRIPGDRIDGTNNIFRAFKAALNTAYKNQCETILTPGFGTGAGRIQAVEAAKQMRLAYDIFTRDIRN